MCIEQQYILHAPVLSLMNTLTPLLSSFDQSELLWWNVASALEAGATFVLFLFVLFVFVFISFVLILFVLFVLSCNVCW